MGLRGSKLSVPPVPNNHVLKMRHDDELNVGISHLDYLQTSGNFGVWHWFLRKHKKVGIFKRELSLWLRKHQGQRAVPSESGEIVSSPCTQVDLEDFHRVQPDQGRVWYSALFSVKPVCLEVTQQTIEKPGEGKMDYSASAQHLQTINNARGKAKDFHRTLSNSIMSKFEASFRVDFKDGTVGRTKDFTDLLEVNLTEEKPMYLEINLTGVVKTSYYETKTTADSKTTKTEEIVVHKAETVYVDEFHYRLHSGTEIVAEWTVKGNLHDKETEVAIKCKFFTVKLKSRLEFANGDWSDCSYVQVITKPKSGMDCALALLIAHVISAEFSVLAMQQYIKIDTPSQHPEG